jgi:hypothetical protein
MSLRRIAMWSGPRNISTAMMRAWENRGDCVVSDEPLYAHYLAHTGIDHPGADEVIAHGETDWRRVVASLTTEVPAGASIWYQKHMSHHLLPHLGCDWVLGLENVFLIRDPAEVVGSYLKKRERVNAHDIGLPQQVELFDAIAQQQGFAPPVIDAGEFLRNPQAQLEALCARLGISFTSRMLSWPAGPRASDGIWARHWYDAVRASTGFEPWRPREFDQDASAQDVVDACRPAYERLHAHRLQTPSQPA